MPGSSLKPSQTIALTVLDKIGGLTPLCGVKPPIPTFLGTQGKTKRQKGVLYP
jgi:hypothetical protein